jgi:purine catabolism regulator
VDALTIDRVGVLVGLEMLNAQARKAVESKYIDQFMHDWLTGRIMTTVDLHMRAEACGLKLHEDEAYSVLIIRWFKERPATTIMSKAVKQIRRSGLDDARLYITLLEGELVVLTSRRGKSLGMHGTIFRDRVAALLRCGFPEEVCKDTSVCVGKTVVSPNQVHESFRQAQKVLQISRVCELREQWITYEELGGYQLLYLLPDCTEVDDFKKRWIEPLLHYDDKHHTLLIQTIKAYFRSNENIRKTALQLITHYNTVVYRLDRVKEVLGIDLENPNDRLQLQLALLLYEMGSHK